MFLEGFLPQLLSGAKLTIIIASCSAVIGLILGFLGAIGELSTNKIIYTLTRSITSIIRGLPEMLVLFAIYFGGAAILTKIFKHYTEINAFAAGVIGLAIIFAAYATQIFRGALLAIPSGQIEAAKSLGLSQYTTFKNILLPQAWRHALPGVSNLLFTTLKDSSLVALIGLTELMGATQTAAHATHQPFKFYMVAAVMYLVITSVVQFGMKYFGK